MTDLQTALQVQVYKLNSLPGKPETSSETVKNEFKIEGLTTVSESKLLELISKIN